jgi:lysophospholipase L1-like esterase
LLATYVIASAGYAALRLRRSARLAEAESRPYTRLARPEGARLLVVGDSRAAGAGASSPECSLPGLLSRANPSLTVVNRGFESADVAATLAQLEGGERFDAVLVMVGANDVLRPGSDAGLRASIDELARSARRCSELVVFLPPGNLGNLRFLLPPWNWWVGWRSRRLQDIVEETARAHGALCVSLFQEREDDPFARHPKRLQAADGLHPNDAGYELWQRELEIQVQLSARLRRIGRSAASRSGLM